MFVTISSLSCTEPLGVKHTEQGLNPCNPSIFLKRLNIMGIVFSSVVIVLLLVVFAAVTQAAVEYFIDCDDNNTKKEM